MPRLVVFRGDAVENEIRLSGGAVRIGRHAGNDVVLDDSLNGVSRFHAEIRPEGNSYVIVDLNSRNGVWIGGKRIKDKAALLLGVPVTVGAFELALEDDPSGTFDGHAVSPRTVVTVPLDTGSSASGASASSSSASRSGASVSSSRSTPPRPRPAASSMSPQNKQILIWAAAIVGVLVICVVTYAALRRRTPPPPPLVAQAELPPTTTIPPPVETPAPPPEDPNKALNEQDLQAARDMIAAGNLQGAIREHLQPLLERSPEDAIALDLKRTTEETLAARAAKPKPVPKPVEAPAEPEIAGIARKTGEAYTDYTARAKGLQVNFSEGKAALDKGEYPVGLARLRLVERDAPNYQGVTALIADGTAKQQAAVDKAIDSGQQNETANNLKVARQWYDQALLLNPSSVIAREKRAGVFAKLNQQAGDLFAQGTAALKTQNTPLAKRLFQQVYDMLTPGDEYRDKAAKQLESLK